MFLQVLSYLFYIHVNYNISLYNILIQLFEYQSPSLKDEIEGKNRKRPL